jgi:hypothetical protein
LSGGVGDGGGGGQLGEQRPSAGLGEDPPHGSGGLVVDLLVEQVNLTEESPSAGLVQREAAGEMA